MDELLSPRQFAEAIGVSESSVRRWADDGLIKMSRTPGGHRKISRTEAIRFVRDSDADLVRPDLLAMAEPTNRRRRVEAFASQHEEVFDALCEGKPEVVAGLLMRMYTNGVGVAEICDGPVRHAMQRIGEMWPHDERAIFVEHRATAICIEALNRLQFTFPEPPAGSPRAIGGAPENDPYSLPSLAAKLVLSEAGFQVTNLGPHTPLKVLLESALELEAKLIWIAFSTPLPKDLILSELKKFIARMAAKQVEIVLGGQFIFRDCLPQDMNVHHFSSMAELAAFAAVCLERSKKAR